MLIYTQVKLERIVEQTFLTPHAIILGGGRKTEKASRTEKTYTMKKAVWNTIAYEENRQHGKQEEWKDFKERSCKQSNAIIEVPKKVKKAENVI